MLNRAYVVKETQTKQYLVSDHLCVCRWPGLNEARTSTGTVKTNSYAWDGKYSVD